MDKKKLITSGVLATVVAVSGQFVQTGTTSGDSFLVCSVRKRACSVDWLTLSSMMQPRP